MPWPPFLPRVLALALLGLASVLAGIRVEWTPPSVDACCGPAECCCADEAPSCCEDPRESAGPVALPACECGRHGNGPITVSGLRWVAPAPTATLRAPDDARSPEGHAPARWKSRSPAPEPPPPRAPLA